jgi:hypothetical protein
MAATQRGGGSAAASRSSGAVAHPRATAGAVAAGAAAAAAIDCPGEAAATAVTTGGAAGLAAGPAAGPAAGTETGAGRGSTIRAGSRAARCAWCEMLCAGLQQCGRQARAQRPRRHVSGSSPAPYMHLVLAVCQHLLIGLGALEIGCIVHIWLQQQGYWQLLPRSWRLLTCLPFLVGGAPAHCATTSAGGEWPRYLARAGDVWQLHCLLASCFSSFSCCPVAPLFCFCLPAAT